MRSNFLEKEHLAVRGVQALSKGGVWRYNFSTQYLVLWDLNPGLQCKPFLFILTWAELIIIKNLIDINNSLDWLDFGASNPRNILYHHQKLFYVPSDGALQIAFLCPSS